MTLCCTGATEPPEGKVEQMVLVKRHVAACDKPGALWKDNVQDASGPRPTTRLSMTVSCSACRTFLIAALPSARSSLILCWWRNNAVANGPADPCP